MHYLKSAFLLAVLSLSSPLPATADEQLVEDLRQYLLSSDGIDVDLLVVLENPSMAADISAVHCKSMHRDAEASLAAIARGLDLADMKKFARENGYPLAALDFVGRQKNYREHASSPAFVQDVLFQVDLDCRTASNSILEEIKARILQEKS